MTRLMEMAPDRWQDQFLLPQGQCRCRLRNQVGAYSTGGLRILLRARLRCAEVRCGRWDPASGVRERSIVQCSICLQKNPGLQASGGQQNTPRRPRGRQYGLFAPSCNWLGRHGRHSDPRELCKLDYQCWLQRHRISGNRMTKLNGLQRGY